MLHFISFKDYLQEAFKDIGKLSPEQLTKGQRLSSEDAFAEVDARVFYNVISKIKTNDLARGSLAKGLDTLTVYSINEYKKMSCFLGDNNSSGYAIAHETELVSVFSSQGSSGNAIVKSAIKNGANHLDCFATRDSDGDIVDDGLFKLYSRNGFKIDTSKNDGVKGEAYSIQKGVSSFVDENEVVHEDDPRVVIFMKL